MKYEKEFFKKNINNVIKSTNLKIGTKIEGKVRDSYIIGKYRLLVATDRISAFDRVLTAIPFKGEILTKLSNFWFNKTSDIVPNHIVKLLYGNSVLANNAKVIPLEVIVRGYLTGSIWRAYKKNEKIKDLTLPPDLKEYHRFKEPMVCFTTKAAQGEHDEPISQKEIIERELLTSDELKRLCDISLKLFERGNKIVSSNNLILVDTKYEFGIVGEEIILVDEIHTQDSSRYIIKDEFERNKNVRELDKEYFRIWLMKQGYSGDGQPPLIPEDIKIELISRYVDAYNTITSNQIELTVSENDFERKLMKELNKTINKDGELC